MRPQSQRRRNIATGVWAWRPLREPARPAGRIGIGGGRGPCEFSNTVALHGGRDVLLCMGGALRLGTSQGAERGLWTGQAGVCWGNLKPRPWALGTEVRWPKTCPNGQ